MDINKDINELKIGFKKMFKEFFNAKTNKLQRANMWTFSRLVIAFCIPILIVIGKTISSSLMYFVAALGTLCGALTDFMDGRSARKHNSVSNFGKHLDIITDKVFSFMLGISLSILNPVFLISLLGEVVIASTNIGYKMKYNYLKTDSIMIGKIKQWPLSIAFVLGFLSLFLPQLSLVTNIFIAGSAILQLDVLYNYVKYHKQQIKEYNDKISIPTDDNNNAFDVISDVKSDDLSLKEEYIRLRNVLNEIINLNSNNDTQTKPKVKKREK